MSNTDITVKKVTGAMWNSVYALVRKARDETDDYHFLTSNPKKFTAYIIYRGDKAIGYCTWNFLRKPVPENMKWLHPSCMGYDYSQPCLRQIYVVPEERRKGYGSKLLTESRRMFSASIRLVVESPNANSIKLLIHLGLVRRVKGDLFGAKGVSFIGG
jgi:GNAT superfamily N-acetyltransferase